MGVVALLGEHDVSTADEVAAAIGQVFDAGSNLVLDLSGATFIDSSVAVAIMRAKRRVDANDEDELLVVAPTDWGYEERWNSLASARSRGLCESRTAALDMLTYR